MFPFSFPSPIMSEMNSISWLNWVSQQCNCIREYVLYLVFSCTGKQERRNYCRNRNIMENLITGLSELNEWSANLDSLHLTSLHRVYWIISSFTYEKRKKKIVSSFRLYLHSGFVEGFIEENDKAKKKEKEEEEEGVKRRI